jgi:transposase
MGRPSIDPELMVRMQVVGYVFAIRSERLLQARYRGRYPGQSIKLRQIRWRCAQTGSDAHA